MNSKGEKQSKNYVKIESIGEGYYAAYETNSKYEIINTKGKKDIHDYFMGESQVFEFDGKVYALLKKVEQHIYMIWKKVNLYFLLKENINYIMVSI